MQLRAADLLCKAGDADDVRRLQVFGEEIATRFGRVFHLKPSQKTKLGESVSPSPVLNPCSSTHRSSASARSPHGSQQKVQHALLSHGDAGRVGEVDQSSHHLGAHVAQGDLGGAALFEAPREHGSEVRTARGQDHFVHLNPHTCSRRMKNCTRGPRPTHRLCCGGVGGTDSKLERISRSIQTGIQRKTQIKLQVFICFSPILCGTKHT